MFGIITIILISVHTEDGFFRIIMERETGGVGQQPTRRLAIGRQWGTREPQRDGGNLDKWGMASGTGCLARFHWVWAAI